MTKVIIRNESDLDMGTVLDLVCLVVDGGRVSAGGYCYVTTFTGYVVYAVKNKKSDTFTVVGSGWNE